MDGLVPISALPVNVDGRNLLWRRIRSNAIRTDPAWHGGNPTEQPRGFLDIMPIRRGKAVMVPAGPSREAHRTQVKAAVWAGRLAEFPGGLAPLPPLPASAFPPAP